MKINKIISVVLVVIMVLSISACGKIVDKVVEKGIEKGVESMIEKETGAKVDFSEDGVKVNAEGGSMQTGENLKWPKKTMGDLPELQANILFIMEDTEKGGCTLNFKGINEKKAKDYVNKLKDAGFTAEVEQIDDTTVLFTGKNSDGKQVMFAYSLESEDGTLTYALGQ
ncbi:MAG: hypothetical protein PHC45_00280 [Clostridiaceae bacterium]|nr:hypothetical protein [Clostridiaceae bacterium]